MAVVWTERARDDLRDIFSFIAQDDRNAAARWVDRLVQRAELAAILDDRYRSMTAAERVMRALALSEASDLFALAKLRADHPSAPPEELRLRLALRTLPPRLGRILATRRGHPELADGHR